MENIGAEQANAARSEAMKRTRQIFEMMSKVRDSLKGLQIIMLEHADENTWWDVSGVAKAANWRGGKGLIPPNWQS